jgi:glycine oxidase
MAGRTIWEDTVAPEDLAALHGDAWEESPDVLVVGGGIIGLGVAAMCVRAGLGRVQVIERGRAAGGVSGSAAGGLSPGTHFTEPESFRRLAVESLDVHRELDAEWDYGLQPLDWLVVVGDGYRDVAGSFGTDVLDPEAAAKLVPALARSGALHIAGQARVHPLRMAAAFARHAGSMATGVEMLGFTDEPLRVRTTRGEVSPGALVLATGTGPGAEGLVRGHLIATEPAPFRLEAGVASPDALILQLPEGNLVCGGTLDDSDADEVSDDVVERVRAELVRLLPPADALAVTHRWCCFRPAAPDELPVVDRIAERVWVSAGHHRTGLLMSPGAGRAVAEWISTGERPSVLDGLGVGRMA